jgi:hypothetical protein
MQLFEYIVAFIILIIIVTHMFFRSAPVSDYITYDNDARNETIKSIIVWDTDYSERLENQIIYNLNLLPDSILDSWLNTDCRIVVCPNIKGYLDNDVTSNTNISDNYYTTAYNTISIKGENVIGSKIYILGSSQIIESSLLHEIGHYVYYEYFGATTNYVLPNYETDCSRFIENECDGATYYTSEYEYFAEIFAYTVLHGVSDDYSDTYVMKKFIENY